MILSRLKAGDLNQAQMNFPPENGERNAARNGANIISVIFLSGTTDITLSLKWNGERGLYGTEFSSQSVK